MRISVRRSYIEALPQMPLENNFYYAQIEYDELETLFITTVRDQNEEQDKEIVHASFVMDCIFSNLLYADLHSPPPFC